MSTSFSRVFVTVGTEGDSDGYDVYARHHAGNRHPSEELVARYVCRDRESLRTVLDALGVDGFSRFVRETDQGPTFEYVPHQLDAMLSLIDTRTDRALQRITLIASDVSADSMISRIAAAGSAVTPVYVTAN